MDLITFFFSTIATILIFIVGISFGIMFVIYALAYIMGSRKTFLQFYKEAFGN